MINLYFLCYNVFIKDREGYLMKNTRREFLKKLAYSAPAVVSLGALVEPTDADAHDGRTKPKDTKSKIHTKIK